MWGKGYHALFDRMKEAKDAGSNLHLDCFGSGEDLEEVPFPFAFHDQAHVASMYCCRCACMQL